MTKKFNKATNYYTEETLKIINDFYSGKLDKSERIRKSPGKNKNLIVADKKTKNSPPKIA